MPSFFDRPMEFTETVRLEFACAVYDVRSQQVPSKEALAIIKNQYLTEGLFIEAVENVYYVNEWKFDASQKKKFRNIFREKP